MTKELMRKVIEAGIVPSQAVKLMKRWQLLEEDLPEAAKKAATEEQLMEFVSEVAGLLEETEELPEMRETMLDVSSPVFAQQATVCTVSLMADGWPHAYLRLRTMKDAHGCYLFEETDSLAVRVGNIIWDEGEDVARLITNVMQIYVGDEVRFLRCGVSGISPDDRRLLEERHAKMSNMHKIGEKP